MYLYFIEENIKLQHVPPSMPLIPDNLTDGDQGRSQESGANAADAPPRTAPDGDSDGIDGGTGCNFILFSISVHSPNHNF